MSKIYKTEEFNGKIKRVFIGQADEGNYSIQFMLENNPRVFTASGPRNEVDETIRLTAIGDDVSFKLGYAKSLMFGDKVSLVIWKNHTLDADRAG